VTRRAAVLLANVMLAVSGQPPFLPLPLPPPLPANPPADHAAPVPNDDPHIPDEGARQGRASWALRVYPMQEFDTGNGYVPGSAYQSPEQRKPIQTPGFMVTVPLQ
jgi:hypothetical protein